MNRTDAIKTFKCIMETYCLDKKKMCEWGYAALDSLNEENNPYFASLPPHLRPQYSNEKHCDITFSLLKQTVKEFKLNRQRIQCAAKFAEKLHFQHI